ncbi:MAG: glycosyl transferase family 1, partial [Proteobacteria bacterium]
YKAKLREAADSRVIFAGFRFGEAYRELRSNCYLYIQATEVGGTHPALVEGMAYGNCIIANATPEHAEVLGGAGVYYWRNDFECLSRRIAYLLEHPKKVEEFGRVAMERAKRQFDWERITDQYEELAYKV